MGVGKASHCAEGPRDKGPAARADLAATLLCPRWAQTRQTDGTAGPNLAALSGKERAQDRMPLTPFM